MRDSLIFAGFGAATAAVGVGLILLHRRARHEHLHDTGLSERDRRFFERQYFRRMQTSALTVVLGGLIAVGGRIALLVKSPWIATIYVCLLFVMAIWLMLLGIADAVASRLHAQKSRRADPTNQTNLAEALAEVRATYGLQDSKSPDQES